MRNVRVIPRLDIKGPNLVKGIHLEGLRVMGDPATFAKHYYENGADELFFADVVASLYERNSLHDIISRTAQNIFIPLTVGGGLRSLDDIRAVLRAGADKVSLNTAVINNPSIIKEASREFGSSTIVVTIEATKLPDGRYVASTDNGREETNVEVFEWAKTIEEAGAGEIVITSVDREGTGEGYDLELIKTIAQNASIPVIAHGGARSIGDVIKVINECPIDAVAIASIFHYDYVYNNEATTVDKAEGNVEFLKNKRAYSKFETCGIKELKSELTKANIPCRP